MIKLFLSYLVLFGLKSNLIVNNTTGILELQREKKYTSFRIISAFVTSLGVLLCSLILFLIYNYILSPLKIVATLGSFTFVVVMVYNLIVSKILSKKSQFNYYLYDRSASFAFDSIYIASTILIMNFSVNITTFVIQALSAFLAIFVSLLFIGFYISFCNRSYVVPSARKVPIVLLLLAIFSILFYYLGLIFV